MTLSPGQIKSFETKRRVTTTSTIRHRGDALAALKKANIALMAAMTELESLGVPEGQDNSPHYLAEAAIQVKWATKQLLSANDAMISLDTNKVAPDHRPLDYSKRATSRVKRTG